jgi:murein DD-endopeptidase MepM/ murein hydrolase activator NlpD
METIAGNHVNLDLGGGVYAMYAHLQPGSIRVKLGDKVTPGQVIALLGSSGNCGEPHLHFQLMDRNSPLNSEGLPYYFPGFKLAARISGDSEGQVTEAPAHLKVNRLPAPEAHHGDIPLENEVVDFEP